MAHLLAMAVLEKDPNVKLAIGPTIDNGFYYDFEFSSNTVVSQEDIGVFEAKIKKIIGDDLSFTGREVSVSEAREIFKNQPYKLELIDELEKTGKKITVYTSGNFTDLCRGGHVENTREIDPESFALTHTAGAYWRGNEKNKMLTRIYGLAFENKELLEKYELQMEEAKKRDHRKIGKELDLFTFSPLVGSGLPLWTPKGTVIRELLDGYVYELRKEKGYERVTIPHITKKHLYETSGHWAKFYDGLFKITTREGHEYALKPMNCPHHTQIFARSPVSYRNMPVRYCDTTMVYRDEQSGEIAGLMRVISITQDDAHVFCRENQVEEEVLAVWNIINTFYSALGFSDLKIRFSRHDPEHLEQYLGTPEIWKKAEDQIKNILIKNGVNYIDGPGEAAMYGPKIDFMANDSIGRTHQVATIQLDFNQPERFDLSCTNEKGEKERIVMIHCAVMGSIERFMAVLIEHYGGAFPLWLSPVQISIIPVLEKHAEYAENISKQIQESGLRVEIDKGNDSLGKRIRSAKINKIPYILVVGDKEIESNSVSVESRDHGQLGAQPFTNFISSVKEEQGKKK